jgi:hypothetical protein
MSRHQSAALQPQRQPHCACRSRSSDWPAPGPRCHLRNVTQAAVCVSAKGWLPPTMQKSYDGLKFRGSPSGYSWVVKSGSAIALLESRARRSDWDNIIQQICVLKRLEANAKRASDGLLPKSEGREETNASLLELYVYVRTREVEGSPARCTTSECYRTARGVRSGTFPIPCQIPCRIPVRG